VFALEVVEPKKPDRAERVFAGYLDGWRQHVKGTNPPRLDDKRRRLIERQANVFPVEDLEHAARGIWRSRWHLENPRSRISLEIALRDAPHIERFRDISLHGDTEPAGRLVGLQPPARPGEFDWQNPDAYEGADYSHEVLT
jgi:hypothetical protein